MNHQWVVVREFQKAPLVLKICPPPTVRDHEQISRVHDHDRALGTAFRTWPSSSVSFVRELSARASSSTIQRPGVSATTTPRRPFRDTADLGRRRAKGKGEGGDERLSLVDILSGGTKHNPDTTDGTAIYAYIDPQLIGIYGSPMECLGKGT